MCGGDAMAGGWDRLPWGWEVGADNSIGAAARKSRVRSGRKLPPQAEPR